MIAITTADFARRCGGSLVGLSGSEPITGFATDSREVTQGSLFLAIKGAQVDGHDFAEGVVAAGAIAVLAERPVRVPHILVPDLVQALAGFAKSKRAEFGGPVVGITGSNGKTSAKEFTAAALSPLGSILKNPGNKNTEYTAPLIWAELEGSTKAVVSEMAMRGFGQIDHLAQFTQPNLAIITMIGTAHIEMVGSREGIARAKAEILSHLTGPAILWAEDDFIGTLRSLAPHEVITFGFSPDADCRIVGYRSQGWNQSQIRGVFRGEEFSAVLPTVGKHQALNAASAIVAAVECGVNLADAAKSLQNATIPAMRMETREAAGVTYVLDNYNASPDSMVAALKTLMEVDSAGRRVAVLGEMRELGDTAEQGHRLVGRALAMADVDSVIVFGDMARWIAEEAIALGFPASRLSQATSLDDIHDRLVDANEGDTVLVKGSRALFLERALEGIL